MLPMLSHTQKVWAVGFGSLIKPLLVITVCRNAFHDDVMAYTRYKFMKVPSTEFLWHV